MRIFFAVTAIIVPTSVFAVDVMPIGSGQFEIVQEVGFAYSQDVRQGDAARFCKKRGRRLQVIADENSLRFTCVRGGR